MGASCLHLPRACACIQIRSETPLSVSNNPHLTRKTAGMADPAGAGSSAGTHVDALGGAAKQLAQQGSSSSLSSFGADAAGGDYEEVNGAPFQPHYSAGLPPRPPPSTAPPRLEGPLRRASAPIGGFALSEDDRPRGLGPSAFAACQPTFRWSNFSNSVEKARFFDK